MSIRYGIDLVLQPSYTAKIYQTRQIVCGQYSSWAAEMQMLRMALTPFFWCPDDGLAILASQVEAIARETSTQKPYTLSRTGIVADRSRNGVVIEFHGPPLLFDLQRRVMEAARSSSPGLGQSETFQPSIALLEYGAFPEAILPGRCRFCRRRCVGRGNDGDGAALAVAAYPLHLRGGRRRLERGPLGR